MVALNNKTRLIRISIWDELMIDKKITKLNDMLFNPSKKDEETIKQYFERRLIQSYI
jgi:hypothetical protein